MNLQQKLEEIRRKPAHIRLRYTYVAVAVSMFFILILWFFSLSDTVKKATIKKQNVFEGLETQKKSLQDATNNVKESIDTLNESFEEATLNEKSSPEIPNDKNNQSPGDAKSLLDTNQPLE